MQNPTDPVTAESPATTSLVELIALQASERGGSPYLEDARSDRTLTYSGLDSATAAWSSYLEAADIPARAFVLVDVGDPLSFAAAHLGVIAAGRISVPTNPELSWPELMRVSERVGEAAVVVTDRADPGDPGRARLVRVDATTGAPDPAPRTRGHAVDRGRGAVLLFTSGSTGEPKGVQLEERQLLFVAHGIARHNELSPSDRGYNPLPLFHVNAEVVGLLATLVAGATLVLDRRFHRTGFWQLLERRRITWLNAVPAMLAVLARGGDFAVPDGLRFVRSASAPLPDAVRSALGDVPLVVSYGMTEGASQITATPIHEPPRAGSVGVPVGCEVEARNEEGVRLRADEIGSLWIRGAGVVSGYFAGRAADRFDGDGWLNTGDLGRVDSDGYVYLVGRSDDVINRGGEKVYPSEVEDVLLGDPRVREAVVVARPDDILHQVPVAYVIATDGDIDEPALVAELAALCASRLPRFKRPVEISVVEDVPRAPTGKVQRSRVRAMAAGA